MLKFCVSVLLVFVFSMSVFFFLPCCALFILRRRLLQVKNSLRGDLCLDQGPDTDNAPIMYLCHGMTPQVRGLILQSSALPRISTYTPFAVAVKAFIFATELH